MLDISPSRNRGTTTDAGNSKHPFFRSVNRDEGFATILPHICSGKNGGFVNRSCPFRSALIQPHAVELRAFLVLFRRTGFRNLVTLCRGQRPWSREGGALLQQQLRHRPANLPTFPTAGVHRASPGCPTLPPAMILTSIYCSWTQRWVPPLLAPGLRG